MKIEGLTFANILCKAGKR